MKNKNKLFVIFILLISISACGGYKPIFGSKNLEFKISKKIIEGDKKLGNIIYSKLENISRSNQNNPLAKNFIISLNISKEKKSTVKDQSGKVQNYKIILNTDIQIIDANSNNIILSRNLNYSSSFEVQKQYSETKKLEDQTTQNLINKTYQELLVKISEGI